jgi:hypothetical protein
MNQEPKQKFNYALLIPAAIIAALAVKKALRYATPAELFHPAVLLGAFLGLLVMGAFTIGLTFVLKAIFGRNDK